ncbi:hypothetical protein [Streptomyces erythrochromogenes]|uniref:hypothetical protein n=1 Tax=Streptomyces erythrochromogenes TaxID=285574 RepID=UPI0002D9D4A7
MNRSTRGPADAFRRRYGASALHLLLVLASFALALYAGIRLLRGDAVGVTIWFVGAALLHDLVLLPLYSVTDRAAQYLWRAGAAPGGGLSRPSINYFRVPAFVAGILFLVWWPLILQQGGHYTASTGLPADGFLARWLLITAGLFIASATVLIVRTWLRLRPRRKEMRAQARARKATS